MSHRTYTVYLKQPPEAKVRITANDVYIEYTESADGNELAPVAYDFQNEDEETVSYVPFDNVLFMESQ